MGKPTTNVAMTLDWQRFADLVGDAIETLSTTSAR